MKIEQVRKLSPLDRMLYWITERESIRLKKESGLSPPFTDDTILQSYRFCNIRRADDKVSQWLINEWYKPYYNHSNMVLACALARFINLPSSLERLTKLVFTGKNPGWNTIKITLRALKEFGPIFNGAYMVRGNDGEDKVDSVVDYYVKPLEYTTIDTDSMEITHKHLCESYGIGSFMGGQIVADLRWAMDGTWLDRCDWAPMGPGSKRGMNRLLGLDIKSPMNQACFEKQLRLFIQEAEDNLPDSITSRMEAIDWQNCCCEWDKHERTLFDGRKPKQKYKGV